jgi:hypothetical protein
MSPFVDLHPFDIDVDAGGDPAPSDQFPAAVMAAPVGPLGDLLAIQQEAAAILAQPYDYRAVRDHALGILDRIAALIGPETGDGRAAC